jgi:hypothetical protein
MSIGSVSSSAGVSDPFSGLRKALQPRTSSTTQSPAQEATETAAQTQTEAAKGDSQAKLKLAHEQAAQAALKPADSDGDHDASSLNVKA